MLIFCCLLGSCDNASQQQVKQSPVRVGISTLHFQPLTLSISLPGRTSALRSAEVHPQVSGVILKRLFREGSEVKAGQQLYQIDPTTYQASYEKARVTMVNAENVVNRYKALIRENAVSKQTWDAAVADYAQAKAGGPPLRLTWITPKFMPLSAGVSGVQASPKARWSATVSPPRWQPLHS